MSVGPITILDGVGGRDETKVVAGDEDGHILISQNNKVLVMKVSESAILQSWYSSPNQPVIAAVNNQEIFPNSTCVVAYDGSTVAAVNNLGTKLTAFEKTILARKVFTLVAVKDDHLVVFIDGTVGSLKGLIQGHKEGDQEECYSAPILDTASETLLDAFILEGSVSSLILVSKSLNGELKLTYGRMSLGEEKPVITGLQSNILGKFEDFLSWDVFTGSPAYLLLWKKSGEILYTEDFVGLNWRTVDTQPNCYDSEICAISKDFCAVACSRHGEDGGKLMIISIQFQCVSSEAPLKTTVHKGRGLYYVCDYLFIVGGGRIAFGSVTDLDKNLDEFIGQGYSETIDSVPTFGALSLYQTLPKLYESGDTNKILEAFTTSVDVPEDLIVDFVDYITSEKSSNITTDEKKEILKSVFSIALSDKVLACELARLSMEQGLTLLEFSLSILEDSTLDPVCENRLVSWIDLILSTHYVNVVVAKDERAKSVLDALYTRVLQLEMEIFTVSNLVSLLDSLSSLAQAKAETTHDYSIQIRDL